MDYYTIIEYAVLTIVTIIGIFNTIKPSIAYTSSFNLFGKMYNIVIDFSVS